MYLFERERASIPGFTLRVPQQPGLCRVKARSLRSNCVSHVGGRKPSLEPPSPAASQAHMSKESGPKLEALRVEPRDAAGVARGISAAMPNGAP